MSEKLQKSPTTTARPTAAAAVRATRGVGIRSPRSTASAKPTILSKDVMRRIGYTLAGKHWQADVAQMMGISKSQMTRWLNGSRTMPPTLNIAFEQVIYDKMIALADCLTMPGMPRSEQAYELRALIRDQVDPLRIKQTLDD